MVLGGLEEEEPSNRSDLVLLHNVEGLQGIRCLSTVQERSGVAKARLLIDGSDGASPTSLGKRCSELGC